MHSPERGFISYQPASKWEEALISGNGKMGAMAMSQPLHETIILTHERLFLPIHEPLPPVDTASHLAEIRYMMSNGDYRQAADLVVKLADEAGYNGKRWTDPFFPACDLLVSTNPDGAVQDYARTLDYATGVASVYWTDERGAFERKVFVSRPNNIVVMQLKAPQGKLDAEIRLDQRPIDGEGYWKGPERAALALKGYKASAEQEWLVYTDQYNLTAGGYAVVARVTTKGGDANAKDGKIAIIGADEALVTLRICPIEQFADLNIERIKTELAALPTDFDELLQPHAQIHGEIFKRVTLDLNGGKDRELASEELVERSHKGDLSPALLEKIFDSGRYAILSSSGDLPPNLQGVWSGTWGPPWSGDYTLNGNVQSALASALNGNMPECLQSFFAYMEALIPDSKTNALRLYNCRGIFVASRTSTHGFQNHFDRIWPMTFWTVGAAWASQFFYDYYVYTGDKAFLHNQALPYMMESALFFEDFLFEGEDGKYIFSPSYSPENNPTNNDSQACINATMDIALVKELLTNLAAVCKELNIEQEGIERWKVMLAKMPAYMINKDGAVKEWTTPLLEDNYHHRHCSHLYPLYNGVAPDIAANPKILAAFRKAMDYRIEVRKQESGGGVMAFGLIQLGLSASSLNDADTVSMVIDKLASNYYYANIASSHDPGEVFNTDISGGLPAVIIKSLVHSQPGTIELLPACPKQMKSGRISGALCRGQVKIIDMTWSPTSIKVTLESAKDQTVKVKVPNAVALGNCLEVKLIAGKPIALEIS
ncbi:MAG: glycoside hydrolase N-terminal domain-containing protein [Armatimonadetes bacterium]|nr:glycoside hydrolase N-terminal domain-containing protein [Armatimonadota bacterium]